MKKINLILISTLFIVNLLNAWEINTHRAIDKIALDNLKNALKSNLVTFIKDSKIEDTNYIKKLFVNKRDTIFWYIGNKESNSANVQ